MNRLTRSLRSLMSRRNPGALSVGVPGLSADSGNTPRARIEVFDGINGTVLSVAKYEYNPHGPDWKSALYVVRPGEALPDAIAAALVLASV